jgi:glutamyl-tRNA reductase
MERKLGFLGISHQKASLNKRQIYNLSSDEQELFTQNLVKEQPDISGLCLLVTCNRTEVYFESENTTAEQVLEVLNRLKGKSEKTMDRSLFDLCDNSLDTLRHLLEVSAGLQSSVLGDAEIIHQIKNAFLRSRVTGYQGSLLERAMQSVSRTHKRINNETGFRDGTTSLAYKSLKLVKDRFKGKENAPKILFVGAGEIVHQLFKYNKKFKYKNISVSNRTMEKARDLAENNACEVYPWQKVLLNDFADFDVIISAVSQKQNLIRKVACRSKQRILIDLAVPVNMDPRLSEIENIRLFDLEALSAELEDNKESRKAAIDKVRSIISQEEKGFKKWLDESPKRAFLSYCSLLIRDRLKDMEEQGLTDLDQIGVKELEKQVLRKLMAHDIMHCSSEELMERMEKELEETLWSQTGLRSILQ